MLDSHNRKLAFIGFLTNLAVLVGGPWIGNTAQAQDAPLEIDSLSPPLDSTLIYPSTAPLENRVRYSRKYSYPKF